MRIEIINVQAATKPTKTGKTYVQLDVAYKNLTREGKIEGKKIMPFQNPDVHANLQKATMGQVFEVTTVKEGEYWQWSNVQEVAKEGLMNTQQQSAKSYSGNSNPTPKSTYETPEERATRQRLIVRQSCLSNAIETLKVDKKGVDPTEALKLAERYVGWVFGEEAKVDVPDVGFDSMEDDVPM